MRSALKTRLIVYLVVLLVSGMGLVEVIASTAFERVILQEKKASVKRCIDVLRFQFIESDNEDALRRLLREIGPSCQVLVGPQGPEPSIAPSCDQGQTLAETAMTALGSTRTILMLTGRTWGVFWSRPRYLVAAAGLTASGARRPLAVAMAWDLEPMYQRLRQPQKALMAYIFINTLILTLIGFSLMWNATGRPIARLVRRAEEFRPDDPFFLRAEPSDNEFDKLSRSLNGMLKRISNDRETLRQTVRSLERANDDLVQAQGNVVRAEKLASTGRLASGLAHEIGNPIGIIIGYLDLLREPQTEPHEREEFIARAQREIERIDKLIRQMLDLSKPSSVTVKTISVHGVIEDLLEVVKGQPVLAGIDVDVRLEADQDLVTANADQLRQVFLNLIINAADAIAAASGKEPGRLEIRTERVERGGRREVDVMFTDNGTGMDEAQIGNIFDPFFTTKPPGKGTGLGLSVCIFIVEGLGGSIQAHSDSGKGSTVSVRLPLTGS